jgi:glycosyltransferase involved in cell wall biosynthesis
MRRIVAFFQHMPPYSGAAALRGKSIMESLAILQPELFISVFCSTPDTQPIEGVTIATLQVPQVENSLSLKRRLMGEIHMGFAASWYMFFQPWRADLAIISSPGYLAALVQTFFARWLGIPYVLEMRDIYPQVYVEASLMRRSSIIFKLFSWFSQRMYRGASLVICATQGLAREVVNQAPQSRVQYVYNGFPAQFAERRGDKYDRFTVCFHGILGFFQDVGTLLEVAKRLEQHDIDVIVIGYGRKEELFRQSKLNNLSFLGRKSFEETILEVERCHLGLCLRHNDEISKDAFPVKVWEYIGLGIPMIITPPCEAGDFVLQYDCGIVLNAGDTEGVVNNILDLKNDFCRLEQLSMNCRSLSSNFTREKTGLAAAGLILDQLSKHQAK